ncbi:DUF6796 family protein [Oceanithermus sp.]
MSNNLRKTAVILGLAGMAGALALFAGDMLFYFNPESTDLMSNMASAAPARIEASALCALLAAWLYTLGAGQVWLALQPAPGI